MKILILLNIFFYSTSNLYAHPGHHHKFIHFDMLYVVTILLSMMILISLDLFRNKKKKKYMTFKIKNKN